MQSDLSNVNISVVMATYNGEHFLRKQLDSILSQTISPKEIIIVDDCSIDSTVAIVQEYCNQYPTIRLISNEKNLGYIGNFEKGMRLTKGDFIALSDQDDIWLPNKLEKLYQGLGAHLLIYSDSELIDESDNPLHKKMSDIKNQIAYDNCLMYTIGAWAPGHAFLFKKELLERCIPFPTIVTHDFWIGFVATCYSTIQYLPEPLVQYRQHNFNAIGADTHAKKENQTKPSKETLQELSRNRMRLLFETCPSDLVEQKQVLKTISESYQSNSLKNNFTRMFIFLKYRHLILAYKKKSEMMKILFCIKMFFKIDY
ncbi:MAG: glycosyltransferase family 2 protein [Bacteroidetes bacterium]|nr:glycosyltransferase family 2 protein [Bacteroidota bacterium]